MTGSATADDYKFAIQAFMDDPNVDIIMPWFVFQDDPLEETIVEVLARFQELKKKPILVGAMGGPFTRKIAGRNRKQKYTCVRLCFDLVHGCGKPCEMATCAIFMIIQRIGIPVTIDSSIKIVCYFQAKVIIFILTYFLTWKVHSRVKP